MKLKFYLNNVEVEYDVLPDEYLSQVLRRNGVLSIHIGLKSSFVIFLILNSP